MNTNTHPFRTLLPALAIVGLALSACGQGQSAQPAQPTTAPTPAAQRDASQPTVIDIIAQDFAFAMPKQVQAGLVTLNFMNHGKEFHFATISRSTKPDMSNEDIVKALEAGAQTQQAPDRQRATERAL